jgi:hypothetical protein
MLAITALVMAFAQPFIPVNENAKTSINQTSSIFIDNSFSSENKNEKGVINDIARQVGIELSELLPKSNNHQYLTNDFLGSQQHLFPYTELTKKIGQLSYSPNSQSLQDIIKRQETAIEAKGYSSYIISDFQKNQFSFENLAFDSSVNFTLMPVSPVATKNISIDSIWFTNPVHRLREEEEIHVRLTNYGYKDLESVTVNLTIDGVKKGLVNTRLPANTTIDTLLNFHTNQVGWHSGSLSVEDFPVVFDNKFNFSYYIKESINIVEINSTDASTSIKRAFDTESYFNYRIINFTKVDFDDLEDVNLLIINGINQFSSGFNSSVLQFVKSGGSVAILPAKEGNQETLNQLLRNCNIPVLTNLVSDTIPTNYINRVSPFYQGVFTSDNSKVNLPSIFKYYKLKSNSNGTHLLSTPNKQPILSQWNVEKGQVFLFSIALDQTFSNFSQHSIFLPTFFQMGFNSTYKTNPFYYLDQDELISFHTKNQIGDNLFRVKNADLNVDLIPEIIPGSSSIKLQLHGGIKRAGNYEIYQNDSLSGMVSFNYQRKESKLEYYTSSDLKIIIDSLGLKNFSVFEPGLETFQSDFEQREKGIELWKWFIILTLLFLAIEIVLIRFFKPSVL